MTYRLIGDDKKRVIEWANTKFPDTAHLPFWGEWHEALGHEFNGELIAAVIYNNLWPGNSVDMHVTSRPGSRWLTRRFLSVAFRYPFETLGLRRVTAKVGANNGPIIKLIDHLGFQLEGVHPEAWEEGIPLLSFGLLKKKCRFLGKEFNG